VRARGALAVGGGVVIAAALARLIAGAAPDPARLAIGPAPGPRAAARPTDATPARLPRAPGELAPSLAAIDRAVARRPGEVSDGVALTDADGCATCHPDAAAQWRQSAHSFASFGNPVYRVNVEGFRKVLGKSPSRHCGGCHDMPLVVDGLMTAGEVPADDLRAHSGVSCALCHGIKQVTSDGNGSYVWSRAPIDAPAMGDPASIARHKAQVTVTALGAELCVSCHRGFLSPDLGLPVHLSGIDEPTAWRSSPYAGNGAARVDKVEPRTCLDCHMTREPSSKDELGAKHGTVASHRFVGGHSWMAAMRGDQDQLARTQAGLRGAASIDVAGALTPTAGTTGLAGPTSSTGPAGPAGQASTWTLPADGAPIVAGAHVAVDVVLRNLKVGHRFPGGVLDMQDTWVEVEVADRGGRRLAASGLGHERDPKDDEAHVLRTLVVDDQGAILEEHELPKFRAAIATQTLAAREAQVIRYAFDVPATLAAAELPLTVTARLRHRSRSLLDQAAVCKDARTAHGRAFVAGAQGARDVTIDPCRAQPITLVAEARVELGAGAHPSATRPAWERMYEHGMALLGTVSERLDEARVVLEAALAAAPAGEAGARPRAMVLVQLAAVASKQGRVDDALIELTAARALLPAPGPAALDAIAADALARVWRWREAVAPARAAASRAPGNTAAWVMLARVLASAGDDAGALDAAVHGLALAPRDADLLRSQATALAALGRPEATAALAAYERFRSPDRAPELRIACAAASPRCARERELGHTHLMLPPGRPAPGGRP
jgi:tetratricopeptide (TPR) repeat protein